MTKRETFQLLVLIGEYYGSFTFDQRKVDAWHDVLKGYSFEKLKTNLVHFVANSSMPPRIADLTQQLPEASRVIPTVQETLAFLNSTVKPAQERVVQAELNKIREILGMAR